MVFHDLSRELMLDDRPGFRGVNLDRSACRHTFISNFTDIGLPISIIADDRKKEVNTDE